jgi:hypothetical protein
VVAHDDDGGVGIEFGVGAGGDFAHRHEQGVGDTGGLVFPGFADVQKEGGVWLLALLGKGCRRYFEFEHEFKDIS